jgi:hypothetical protein
MQKTVEHQPEDCCCGAILGKGHIVVLGEEHSAQKLIHSVDFWLYYTAYFCGVTVGLVYSNNLGQIAQSRLTMLLGVYSSCSFFGRLLSALPDFLHMSVLFHIHTYILLEGSQRSKRRALSGGMEKSMHTRAGWTQNF